MLGLKILLVAGLLGLTAPTVAADTQILRASHQWPAGAGDIRDEMMQTLTRAVQEAHVGLDIRVYPGSSLFKPHEQWGALVKGQLDLAVFPLDYASGRYPQFSATLMPGLVKNHAHAQRLDQSPFMDDIKNRVAVAGAVVLADAWLAGGFASKKNCILEPGDIKGQVTRAAGPAFEQMLVGAGASIASMPSSDIYTAMQTGVLDTAVTSSSSLMTYRLYEQAKCLTAPGEHTLWFMYQPILMSKATWDKLTQAQRDALQAAGKAAEAYFFQESAKEDQRMIDQFQKAGVQVVFLSAEQADAWKKIAQETAYKNFADTAPGGKELLEKAQAVE